jgi:sulfotransferase
MEIIHFCGGLPRSGSTVLMNILQQNPKVFTTGTCALFEILRDKILIKSRYSETFQAMSNDQADRAMYGLIHGATKGWFEGLTSKPVVISKRHGWSSLFHLYPKSKFICLVRDLRDIVESFEKIASRTLALHSFNDNNTLTPSMHENEKYKYYFDQPNALSSNLYTEIPRLMEVFKQKSDRVMFIRYEDFTKDPIYILKKLYNFLNQSYFEHDLKNISQSELFEHDHAYFREKTDHLVKKEFSYYHPVSRTLSESLQKRIVEEHQWFYKGFYPDQC